MTIYGLFVEHYQQYQVIWNGDGGRVYFYQSELPYDPPNQASWTSGAGTNGWASYKVANTVTSHEAWGLGIYSVFTNPNIFLTRAIEAPNNANVRFHKHDYGLYRRQRRDQQCDQQHRRRDQGQRLIYAQGHQLPIKLNQTDKLWDRSNSHRATEPQRREKEIVESLFSLSALWLCGYILWTSYRPRAHNAGDPNEHSKPHRRTI